MTTKTATSEMVLTLPDHKTRVVDTGNAGHPTVVLIHSALLDHRVWSGVIAAMTRWRMLGYDLRGHGAAVDAPAITGIEQLSADLGELLDELDVSSAHLVGLSLGGAVAQRYAIDHPERVHSLALIATAARFPVGPLLERARSLDEHDRADTIAMTLRRWFSEGNVAADTPPVRYARQLLEEVDSNRWYATWHALAGFDVTSAAAGTEIPVLAVAGGDDLSTPPDVLRAMADAYPHGSYAEIHGAPHMVPLQRPVELARVLASFLARRTDPEPTSTTVTEPRNCHDSQ